MDGQAAGPGDTWTWHAIFQRCPLRTLRDGEALIVPGERPGRLFYLQSGNLRCSVVSVGGGVKTVFYARAGDFVGEALLFEASNPVPLVVVSVGTPVVRSMGDSEVRRLIASRPELAAELLVSLARKALELAEQVRQLRFLPVEARVAAFLGRAVFRERPGGDGQDLRLTHDEIADYVGAHRVSVSEALGRMEGTGVIETGRGRIVVRDPERLRRMATG